MTEVEVDNAEQQSNGIAGAPSQPSAGQMLRAAREHKAMSLQALASALKVPAHKLQALEEDRWDVLTDAVFTRALALSVCRVLKLAPEPVLAGLPKHEVAKLAANPEGINAPFKEKTLRSLMSASPETHSGGAAKLVMALVIAVAGGAGLYFVPQWQAEGEDAEAAVAEATPSEPLFMPQLAGASAAPEVAPESVQAAEGGNAAEPVAASVPAAVAPSAPAAAVSAPAEAAPAPVAAPVPAVAGGVVLRFVATGETWVQVRDAQQRVVMERILKSGDVLEDTATGRPLQVVVGNASATTLQIDGAAHDLLATARNNVARFEVK